MTRSSRYSGYGSAPAAARPALPFMAACAAAWISLAPAPAAASSVQWSADSKRMVVFNRTSIVVFDSAGNKSKTITFAAGLGDAALSPDGSRAAVTAANGECRIIDLDKETQETVFQPESSMQFCHGPAWSKDGMSATFWAVDMELAKNPARFREKRLRLYSVNRNGTGKKQLLEETPPP